MTRRFPLAALALAAVALPGTGAGADEPRAPATPEQIIEYYEGPDREYGTDLRAATRRAKRSLRSQLERRRPRRPAMVFDIDDTLESTYRCAKESDFDRDAITVCQARTDQDPIKPIWRLLKYAQRREVRIIVITGRPEGFAVPTREQLRRDGLRGRYTLVMRENTDRRDAAEYKTEARRRLQRRRNLKILVNIGDQRSDLAGAASGRRIKVPNPMYFTP